MRRLFAIIVAAIAFVGCSMDDITVSYQTDKSDIYYASFEDFGEESRTYVDEDVKLLWHEDDRISLFRTTLNEQFKFTGATGDNSGGFAAVPSDEWVTGNQVSTNYAVYPYDATTKLSNNEIIQLTMPAVQHYAENSFGRGANTMVAASENTSSKFLPFRNLGGYIIVKLYGEDTTIKSIEFKGNNEEVIAGAATAEAKYGYLPVVSMSESGTTTITLDCGEEGVTISSDSANPTSFWFVVPPITFEGGFTFTITDINGNTFTKSTTKSQTVVRNEVKSMSGFEPTFEGEGEGPEVEETIPNNQIWYTTTDNSSITISTSKVGQVPSSTVYNEEKGRYELTYERDITYISDEAFYCDTKLTSITLPGTITSVACNSDEDENPSFAENTNLVRFGGPLATEDGSGLIVNNVFVAYAIGSSVEDLIIPDGVTSVDCVFEGATNLKSITIPTSVKSMYGSEFYNTGLTSVKISELEAWCNMEMGRTRDTGSVNSNPLYYAGNLYLNGELITDLVVPESITKINDFAFCGGNFNTITLNDKITQIGYRSFANCANLTEITIPASVKKIYELAFTNCSQLVKVDCMSRSVPTAVSVYMPAANWGAFPTNNGLQIHIATTMYKSYSGWNNFRNYMVEKPYAWYNYNVANYSINSAQSLYELSLLTNGDAEALAIVGESAAVTFAEKSVKLAKDVDLSTICSETLGSWLPIKNFSGTFDGNSKTISSLYSSSTSYMGLFANTSGATIKNLTVNGIVNRTNTSDDSTHYVGGVVGSATNSIIENCISDVDITMTSSSNKAVMSSYIGGVCGYSYYSNIVACQYTGNISYDQGEWEYTHHIGGIVGFSSDTNIIACVKPIGNVYGELTQAYSSVGGIVGFAVESSSYHTTACYSNANVKGRIPGMIMGYCNYRQSSGNPNTSNCYYSSTTTKTSLSGTVKGVGSDNYGGSWSGYDSGTAVADDVDGAVADMNTAIDTWNTNNPTILCNYKYANVDGVITLVAAE